MNHVGMATVKQALYYTAGGKIDWYKFSRRQFGTEYDN